MTTIQFLSLIEANGIEHVADRYFDAREATESPPDRNWIHPK